MSFAPSDAPEGAPSAESAAAHPEPVGPRPADSVVPPSSEQAARENAHNGCWAMNEHFSGWVLLGADDRPVMRNDGSRVGFFFHDVERLGRELAESGRDAVLATAAPEEEAQAESRAKAWRAHRRALAPLDSGFNADWDPQRPKSHLADITKLTKLLAYYYAQTTEPEEAVRRAVSVLFGNPVVVNEPRTRLWVPGKYDAKAVISVAETLVGQVLGPMSAGGKDAGTAGAMPGGNASSFSNSLGGVGMAGLGFPETPVSAQLDKTEGPTVGDPQFGQSEDTTGQDSGVDSSVTPLSSGTVPPLPPRKPPPPPEPERDPPRPNVRRQERQWRRTPPQDQPDDVKDALAKSHLKEVWRQVLRRKFETGGRPDEGYGTYVFERGDYAYGAYQFRKPALIQIGVRTEDGRWTGKFGVRGWQDFLNSVEAQEAALAEWTRYLEEAVDLYHTARLGQEISTPEGKINVTRSGLVGAMHLRGRRGVILYMQWIESNNWTSPVQKPANRRDSFNDIEKRLRGFEHVPY